MPQQFSNNARSTLTGTITDSATSFTIQSAAADLFPVANVGSGSLPSASNWFKATLQDVSGNVEIVYVRTRNSGSAVFSNVIRAQEGTTARAFVAGTVVGLRVTAADFQAALDVLGNDNIFTGDNTFNQPITGDLVGDVTGNLTGDVTGDVTGNLTGDVTGDVTGNLTGDVTGDVTGNVTGKLLTTNFTVEQSGTKLIFKNGTTAIASLSATGDLIVAGNVTAFGTV